MNPSFKTKLIWLSLLAIGMAFLESSVVVYLREIYYPSGFQFPMVPIQPSILQVELWRELATLLMLVAIGILTGKSGKERFAWFLVSFAIWDLFYYLFLKILLDWPASLFTWDILFLLPVPWLSPVLAPCILASTMLLLGLVIAYREIQGSQQQVGVWNWTLLLSGSVVVLGTFMSDFFRAKGDLSTWLPLDFPWLFFVIGEGLILWACVQVFRKEALHV